MNKRLLKLSLILVLLTGVTRGLADEEVTIGNLRYSLHDSTATVKGCVENILPAYWNEYYSKVEIPERIHFEGEDFTVTAIHARFVYNNLQYVVIPKTIKSIKATFRTIYSSMKIYSYIEEPFPIETFSSSEVLNYSFVSVRYGVTLYVQRGKKQAYIEAGWGDKVAGPIREYGPIITDNFVFNITNEDTEETSICSTSDKEKLSGHVVIPSQTSWDETTYKVTDIGSNGFSGCINITSIEFPSTIKKINSYAFKRCSGLTSVTIPNSVTSIGNGAFAGCSHMKSISFPDNVEIALHVFDDCESLNMISVNNSISMLSYSTLPDIIDSVEFNGQAIDEPLEKFIEWINPRIFCIGKNVERISVPVLNQGRDLVNDKNFRHAEITAGSNEIFTVKENVLFKDHTIVFYPSMRNGEEYTIPSGILTIGECCFSRASNIEKVTIPSSVKTIESYAFTHCKKLKEIIIPNSVESVKDRVFACCTNLENVTLPRSMEIIENNCFQNCSNLVYVDFPSQLRKIRDSAFQNCSKLTSVILSKKMVYIGAQAFDGCSAVKDIYCLSENPPEITSTTFSHYTPTLHVPIGCKEKYQQAMYWKNFTIVEDEFTGILSPRTKEVSSEYYDLQGRKIEQPDKGGIYIHGGRKVIVK